MPNEKEPSNFVPLPIRMNDGYRLQINCVMPNDSLLLIKQRRNEQKKNIIKPLKIGKLV